jgi:hypothetical protein
MKIRGVFALVGLPIAFLAGCSSPADDLAFQPPSGWRSTPPMFGRMQMWMNGTSGQRDLEILMLVKGTTDSMSRIPVEPGNLREFKRDAVTLCNGQRGQYFTGVGESRNSQSHRQERVEGISARVNGSDYMAFYIRPLDHAADPQAEAAIHSLCAKSG